MADGLPRKALVIDNDPSVTKMVENILKKYRVNVLTNNNALSGLYLFNTQLVDCVIASLEMEELGGLGLFQKIQNHENEIKRDALLILMIGKSFSQGSEALLSELPNIYTLNKPVAAPKLMQIFQMNAKGAKKEGKKKEVLKAVDEMVEAGKVPDAISHIKQNGKVFGEKIVKVIADTLENARNYEQSLKLHKSREAKEPHDISVLSDLGRVYLKMENFEESEKYFEKANEKAPQNIERLNHMAATYLHLKKPDKTIGTYKELLGLTPENQDIKYDMINNLKEHGFDEHATEFCNEVAEAVEMIRFYNNKGVVMSKKGNLENALQEYLKVVEFFPDYKDICLIYFNIALAHMRTKEKGSVEKATEYLKECLRVNPDFQKARDYLDQQEARKKKKVKKKKPK